MNRRTVLELVGVGTVGLAGCLGSEPDDGNGNGDGRTEPNGDAGETSRSDSNESDALDRPSAAVLAEAEHADCPDTDATPPEEFTIRRVETFAKRFEVARMHDPDPRVSRHVSVPVETSAIDNGIARVDLRVLWSETAWDGDATLVPLDGDDPAVDEDDLERVSTSEEPLADVDPLLEAIEDALDSGEEERTVTDPALLEVLADAVGRESAILIEHDDESLYVEYDAYETASEGESYAGYLLTSTDDSVYRVWHDPGTWHDEIDDGPLTVSDDEWERFDCWS
ncbi:hypothetical protein [Halomontanus rarus]|uniref:hypothetical protein n=1 Tax=Halomontanus rarus TaxID=3034020 RepID=UPI001A98A7EE